MRPADACPDSWTTAGGGGGVAGVGANETFYDFGLHGPIPAGFFAEGSDPFGEIVAFVGVPADPNGVQGEMDTLIEHGTDEYGEIKTPLLMAVLDVKTMHSPKKPLLLETALSKKPLHGITHPTHLSPNVA